MNSTSFVVAGRKVRLTVPRGWSGESSVLACSENRVRHLGYHAISHPAIFMGWGDHSDGHDGSFFREWSTGLGFVLEGGSGLVSWVRLGIGMGRSGCRVRLGQGLSGVVGFVFPGALRGHWIRLGDCLTDKTRWVLGVELGSFGNGDGRRLGCHENRVWPRIKVRYCKGLRPDFPEYHEILQTALWRSSVHASLFMGRGEAKPHDGSFGNGDGGGWVRFSRAQLWAIIWPKNL
jgi:hypothetical protein